MAKSETKPYSTRLGIDLGALVEARAVGEGITPSELIRNVLHAWAYSEAPTANEGYYAARGQGRRIAHHLLAKAIEGLPTSDEEMQLIYAEISEARVPARRRR